MLDFFDRQSRARRATIYLVVLYAIAVTAIVGIISLFVGVFFAVQAKRADPLVFVWAACVTVAIILGVSLSKYLELRAGGQVIAKKLGGRPISRSSRDAGERRVLHVVEEMAIASGLPVPPVYILAKESRINAFAAGHAPEQSVIGVTKGCAQLLNRNELQGVVAHEFSHILHGDTRLNTRLIGILHGIMAGGLIGHFLVEAGAASSPTRSQRDNIGPIAIVFGFALWALGSLGTAFGSLIKAAVSRQREYLADASAVQFTRDPTGLAGALRKIGGTGLRGRLFAPKAAEYSHMYVAHGVSKPLFAAFATHPPLEDRIWRLDPGWDGRFPEVLTRAQVKKPRKAPKMPIDPMMAVVAASVLAQAGNPTKEHVDYAQALLARIPDTLAEAAHDPKRAPLVAYALVGEENDFTEQVSACGDEARLPLIDITIPALRQLGKEGYVEFKRRLNELILADDKVDTFEWILRRILLTYLEPHYTRMRVPVTQYYNLAGVRRECAALLSALAHASGDAETAFARGVADLGVTRIALEDDVDHEALDAALTKLRTVSPPRKRELLHACAEVIGADREIKTREAELFRAIADSLDVPMPPLLPGQKLA